MWVSHPCGQGSTSTRCQAEAQNQDLTIFWHSLPCLIHHSLSQHFNSQVLVSKVLPKVCDGHKCQSPRWRLVHFKEADKPKKFLTFTLIGPYNRVGLHFPSCLHKSQPDPYCRTTYRFISQSEQPETKNLTLFCFFRLLSFFLKDHN